MQRKATITVMLRSTKPACWNGSPGALVVFGFLTAALLAQSFKVGDRVEAYDAGWNKGTVVELGSGNYQGYFLVKYDAFTTQRWFKPVNLRPGPPPHAPKAYRSLQGR